tara:strand:+ start:316 stop:2055 length:1740 start_codon:yes stop_codon:yes gene_type:complete
VKEMIIKINSFISSTQRNKLLFLIVLLIIGIILEVFGLGILVPILTLILEPEVLNKNEIIKEIYETLGFTSYISFIYSFLFFITLLYIFKTFYIVYLSYRQNRFVANLVAYISNMLFSKYIFAPYSFHLTNNSSGLVKNIQVEVHNFWNLCISIMTLIVESSLLLSIIITLIYIEPFGAITIGVFFGIFSSVFYQFTKKKIKIWGEERENIDNKNSKIIIEGLGGIKDINVMGRHIFFTESFRKNNFIKAQLWSNNATLSQLPRFFLEMISLIGLVGFVILMLLQGKDVNILITVLGVFVAATFKMIPSLNRIISAAQTLKFYSPSLDILFAELKEIRETQESPTKSKLEFQSRVTIKNVSFSYEGVEEKALKNLNFEINKGETIGFIGESGSGKSTLVDLLIGLHQPTEGNLYIDDKILSNNLREWQNNIGYVSQNIYLLDDTIQSNIAFGIPEEKIDINQINEIINLVQLEEFILKLEKGLLTKVGERGVQLSGGQRQRIGIARALYNNPDILILDEATSALDTKTEKAVMKSINKLKGKKTILIISHRISTLSKTDKIYSLNEGKISNEHKYKEFK